MIPPNVCVSCENDNRKQIRPAEGIRRSTYW